MTADTKVWFITGCSSGLGHELALQVLKRGDHAALTARNASQLKDLGQANEQTSLILPLDVTDDAAIDTAVGQAEAHFGRIDILVNNAGYGYFAGIEEGEPVEIRRQFDTNVFGVISLMRRVLPGMRARRSGHIVNISSMGGLTALPGLGYYNASKFAVEGLSEAVAQEVAPLGIKVTIIEPGRLRTQWAGRSMVETKHPIADYAETAGARRKMAHGYSGSQPGDPVRAAAAIIKAVDADKSPLRLLLGSDAYELATSHLDTLRSQFEASKSLTLSADFPKE